MAGTKAGGMKAKAKNLAKDPNFYSKIGKKGADAYMQQPKSERLPRGFAADPAAAKIHGAKGGSVSRRTNIKNGEGKKAK